MPYISKRRISARNDKGKEESKRRNNKWNKYYQNPRWKKLRDWYISISPLCKDCAIEGRSVPAEEVHHRIPYSWWNTEEDRLKALLCPDLLVPLCKKHHLERHKYLKKPDNFEQTKEYKIIHNMI